MHLQGQFRNAIFYLQAVGIIAAIGDSVKHLKVGTPAAIMTYGSYAEFTAVKHIFDFDILKHISLFAYMFSLYFFMKTESIGFPII